MGSGLKAGGADGGAGKLRIIFLGSSISDAVSSTIIAQLLFLEADNPEKDIYMYINSPGGLITSGFAILDTMNYWHIHQTRLML